MRERVYGLAGNGSQAQGQDYANQFRAFNMAITIQRQAGNVPLVQNCFAIMFTNIGDTIATLNGMVVFPSPTPLTALGDSRTIAGHEMDLYKGNLSVAFTQPVGTNPSLEIVQLFYVLPFTFKPPSV